MTRAQQRNPNLSRWIRGLALDAVEVQRRFDDAHEADLDRLALLEASLAKAASAQDARVVTRALAPSRLVLDSHEVSARVRVESSRERGAGLGVRVLGARHDFLYAGSGVSRSTDARLTIVVEQVPAASRGDDRRPGRDLI